MPPHHRPPLAEAERAPGELPGAVLEDREKRALWEAVAALPEKYRVPLYLYYYEGYAVDEVGELLDLKPSTVQTRLARGRERLKKLLTED